MYYSWKHCQGFKRKPYTLVPIQQIMLFSVGRAEEGEAVQQVRRDVAGLLRQVAPTKPEDDVIPTEPPPAAPSRFAAAVAASVAAADPDAGCVSPGL